MSGASLNLAALQALITLGGYGGRGNNTPSTAVVGLSAALFLSDLSIWQGAGDTLTDAEIDDIQELVAQLETDLMMSDNEYPFDRCSVINSTDQTFIHNTGKTVRFDTEIYDPSGMHDTSSAQNHKITVLREGLHLINTLCEWNYSATGYRQLKLFRTRPSLPSTVLLADKRILPASGVIRVTSDITFQDYAMAGDYYYLVGYQSSGADIDMLAVDTSPVFSVVRL